MRVVLVDNYDSFTFNLANLVRTTDPGLRLDVVTNDDDRLQYMTAADVDAVIISAGPGSPSNDHDVGFCASVLDRLDDTPILGICLGHQLIALAAGGVVEPIDPRHGHVSSILHSGDGLFRGMAQGFSATRYHSFAVRSGRGDLTETAWAEDGTVMGVSDPVRPRWGVQFHPESVETHQGRFVVRNFLDLARQQPRRTGAVRTLRPDPGSTRTTRVPRQLPEVISHAMPGPFDASLVFAACFGDAPAAVWLDDNDPGHPGRSYMGSACGPASELLSYRVGAGVTVRDRHGTHDIDSTIWSLLEQRTASLGGSDFGPLPGGYVGFFGYGCKADLGGGSPHPITSPEPDAVWMRPDRVIEHRSATGDLVLRALITPDRDDHAPAELWLTETAARLEGLRRHRPDVRLEPPRNLPTSASARSDVEYLDDIAACFDYLRGGETYEICLTNQLSLTPVPDPLALYLVMRALNPTARSAYLRADRLHIACTSPEQFLSIDRRRRITTRPIKGTIERGRDPEEDRGLRDHLVRSPKTRAENRIIVDLVRNDLNRVCRPGTVRVTDYLKVETYETLHQLVSTVVGDLRSEATTMDAVKSCFPPGSMTGAPKVRTMELIDRLEPQPRGAYSGALGYFGADGTVDLSVVIRTAVATPGRLTVGTGGAITIDSSPVEELEEAALKARTVLDGHATVVRGCAHRSPGDPINLPQDQDHEHVGATRPPRPT
jgi:para-aminobenzoate synthetase